MFTKTQIYPHEWIKLPATTRFRLAETFGLKKSKGVSVVGGEIQSDGYEPKDLEPMSVGALQKFTGSTSEDFVALLNLAIQKLEDKYSQTHVLKEEQNRLPEPEPEPEPEVEPEPEPEPEPEVESESKVEPLTVVEQPKNAKTKKTK